MLITWNAYEGDLVEKKKTIFADKKVIYAITFEHLSNPFTYV